MRLVTFALLAAACSSVNAGVTMPHAVRATMTSIYVGNATDWAFNHSMNLDPVDFHLDRVVETAGGRAAAQAWLNSQISPNQMVFHGGTGLQTTTAGECSGASTEAMFEVEFVLDRPYAFTMQGFLNPGVGTETYVALKRDTELLAGTEHAEVWMQLAFSGTLEPGSYMLRGAANSFGGACDAPDNRFTNYMVILQLTEISACAADFNGDQFVDDIDFVLFAQQYDLFDCAAPAMPAGCPADLNGDALVEDVDFVLFAQAYDAFVCP